MGWRCRRVRTQLTLLVGDDLADRERRVVEAHLSGCSACREYRASLERSRHALRDGSIRDEFTDLAARSSLWPAISSRLVAAPEPPRRSWLPVASMAAACITMALILWSRAAPSSSALRSPDVHNSSWLPRGIRAVETLNGGARRDLWDAEQPANRAAPAVRSFYLLDDAKPAAIGEAEL